MRFTYEAIWDDMVALARAHRDALLALLGVFVFLPVFAQMLFIDPPKIKSVDWNGIQAAMDYYRANAVPLLFVRIAQLLGGGAMLYVLLQRGGHSVGQSIAVAARLLPSLFILSVLVSFAVTTGLFAFIIPGLYLLARILLAEPAMMAEQHYNPINAIARSFDMTRGEGWRIFGLCALVVAVTWIAIQVGLMLVGIIGALVLPKGAGHFLTAIATGASQAALTLVMTLLPAALYRHFAASGSSKGI
jgi:hypothetical protein